MIKRKKSEINFRARKVWKINKRTSKRRIDKTGVKLPEKGKHKEMFAGLDDQTKESEINLEQRNPEN